MTLPSKELQVWQNKIDTIIRSSSFRNGNYAHDRNGTYGLELRKWSDGFFTATVKFSDGTEVQGDSPNSLPAALKRLVLKLEAERKN